MLRCTIVVLLLYSVLATCRANVLRSDPRHDQRRTTVDVVSGGNSTDYATKRIEGDEEEGSRAVARVARTFGGGTVENDVVRIEGATSRKKKNKGYGNMLLYFMGAAKMTMLYVLMKGVAAIAGKALVVGKLALAIATAIALSKTSEREKVLYEIVKHPYHSYEHTHSSSVDLEQDLGENELNYWNRKKTY